MRQVYSAHQHAMTLVPVGSRVWWLHELIVCYKFRLSAEHHMRLSVSKQEGPHLSW